MNKAVIKKGNERQIWDIVDLLLLKFAKLKRTKISSPDKDENFYESFFTENDEKVFSNNSDPRRSYKGEIMRSVVEEEVNKGGKVLDVGCGTGDNLAYISSDNMEFYGIEYAKSTAQIAERTIGDKAKIYVASATEIPFKDKHFDLLLCMEVLEHIDDHELAMDEIIRVLKPGGRLMMSVPYRHWFPSYFKLIGHYRHYTRTDAETMFETRGLVVKKHLENYPRWARFANYAHVICRFYVILLRLFGKKVSVTDAKLPFASRSLHEMLFGLIEPMRKREIGIDYSKLPTSTFILFEKR